MNFKYILSTFLLLNTMHSWAMLNRVAHNSIKNEITQKNARALIQLKRNFFGNDHPFYHSKRGGKAFLLALSIPAGNVGLAMGAILGSAIGQVMSSIPVFISEDNKIKKEFGHIGATIGTIAGGSFMAYIVASGPGIATFGASAAALAAYGHYKKLQSTQE